MKAIALVVVVGGVATAYVPDHVDCEIVDLDNLKYGDETDAPHTLPRGVGYEELAELAGLVPGKDFEWAAS